MKNLTSSLISFVLILIEGKEEQIELEVFNFTGAGGVALAMYNTDEVQLFSFYYPITCHI
jgi:hypothetical protein